MKITDRSYWNETIELDGNDFRRCTFTECKLVLRARWGVTMLECTFENCEWSFAGAAALVIKFLRSISDSPGDYGPTLLLSMFTALRPMLKEDVLAKLFPDETTRS